jgi:hypothetical protein
MGKRGYWLRSREVLHNRIMQARRKQAAYIRSGRFTGHTTDTWDTNGGIWHGIASGSSHTRVGPPSTAGINRTADHPVQSTPGRGNNKIRQDQRRRYYIMMGAADGRFTPGPDERCLNKTRWASRPETRGKSGLAALVD